MTSGGSQFAENWSAWQAQRWGAVSGPHGTASLADTIWLSDHPQRFAGLVGEWRADGAHVVGTGLAGSGYVDADGVVRDEVRLAHGESIRADGDRVLRAFVRGESPALRVLDPAAPTRTELLGIDAFEPETRWHLDASFESRSEPLEVELVDGYRTTQARTGVVRFTLDGQEHALTVTVRADGLSAVFGDETNGRDSYRFRFLEIPLPDERGRTTIDFTRAYLPPCAFSEHYVCPLPPPGNRFAFAVTAGEKLPVRRG